MQYSDNWGPLEKIFISYYGQDIPNPLFLIHRSEVYFTGIF